jgi:hypothetical protein
VSCQNQIVSAQSPQFSECQPPALERAPVEIEMSSVVDDILPDENTEFRQQNDDVLCGLGVLHDAKFEREPVESLRSFNQEMRRDRHTRLEAVVLDDCGPCLRDEIARLRRRMDGNVADVLAPTKWSGWA